MIIVAGTALRMQNFTDPWTSDHRGWSGSYYGNIARNYVEHGYIETKFGAVENVAPNDSSEFKYYVNHPPLLGLLISVSFRIFGISEWAVRLVPLLASMISLLLVFLIARKLWNNTIALYALLIFAVVPMGSFYGTLADVQGPVVLLFCLLTVYFYLQFRDNPSLSNIALMCTALTLGALTDWPAFYLPPLMILHYYLWQPNAARSRMIFLPLLIVLMLGAAYLPYSNWLIGCEPFDLGRLQSNFSARSAGQFPDQPFSKAFTTSTWLARVLGQYWLVFLGYPIVFALALWTIVTLVHVIRARSNASDGIYLLVLIFALMHILIFRQGAYVHAYWSYYMLAPGSLAFGLCVKKSIDCIPLRHAHRTALAIVVLMPITAFSIFMLHHLWTHESDSENKQIALEINKRCSGKGLIVTDVFNKEPLYFYLKRPIVGVVLDKHKIAEIAKDTNVDYIFLSEAITQNAALYARLVKACPDCWRSKQGTRCSGILIPRKTLAQALAKK